MEDLQLIKHMRTLALLVLVACAKDSRVVPEPALSEAEGSRRPLEKNIYLEEVVPANPVILRGRARTFENNVVVRVRDDKGNSIAEDFTTSVGEMGTHNPFVAEIWLVRTPGKQITAEAFEYSAKDGSVQSLDSRTAPFDVEPVTVTLVFPTSDCTKFEEFGRAVPKTPSMARLLVEALVAGPTDEEKAKGASAPFPKGSDVRSVILRDGVLTVDFNERLQNVGGSCAATAIREAVTRTVRKLPTVRSVVITAAGSEPLALQP